MAEILFRGQLLKLDEPDFHLLNAYSWHWTKTGYLLSKIATSKGLRETISFHRMIFGNPKGFWVDHTNRDPRDCRRLNLRLCSPSDNARNRTHWTESPGVTWNPGRGKWQVVLKDNGKPKWFGYFKEKEEAVTAAKEARKTVISILCQLC